MLIQEITQMIGRTDGPPVSSEKHSEIRQMT